MSEQRVHEIQRGQILRYLAVAGFTPVPPLSLLYHLRDVRYPCTRRDLEFHLQYLAQKGWINIEWKSEEVGKKPEMLSAQIRPSGIDLLDRRQAGEPGVSF